MPEPTKPGGTAVTQPSQQQAQISAQPVEQVVAPQPPVQTAEQVTQPLPGASDRTQEQFAKLLENNQRLFEANDLLQQELRKRSEAAQTFKPVQQPATNTQGVNVNDFIEQDPVTGERYLNETKLQDAVSAINERATRTEKVVENYVQTAQQKDIERQNREAFVAHPELNPNSPSFDAQLNDFTRAVIYDSLINPHAYGGRNLEFKDAAQLVKERMARGVQPKTMDTTVAEIAGTQAQGGQAVTQEAKEQGSLSAVGQNPTAVRQQQQDVDLGELRRLTREGSGSDSNRAIAMRLLKVDHVRKASEEDA